MYDGEDAPEDEHEAEERVFFCFFLLTTQIHPFSTRRVMASNGLGPHCPLQRPRGAITWLGLMSSRTPLNFKLNHTR